MSFEYRAEQLYAEGVPVEQLADTVGTPFYCYSANDIRENYASYQRAFEPGNTLVCYAVKANSNPSVMRLLADSGAGADVVSAGELEQALDAGVSAGRIVYSGVAKTASEMKYALERDIFQFNVESEPELEQLNDTALALGRQAPVAFRINPDIDAGTHEKITTGKSINKFGVPRSRAVAIYDRAASLPGIRVQGIATHIGSQLMELQPFEQAFRCHRELALELRGRGHDIGVLDIGGGLGIAYGDDRRSPPAPEDYAAAAMDILGPLGCRIIIEPGRSLVGGAGILVARVIYVKEGESRRFLIVDAGMNDLLRPSLYDAYHDVTPVRHASGEAQTCDVVGPVCETGDAFARDRSLPPMKAGDLIAIRDVGAYGAVMASAYNSRPLASEVLVAGDRCVLTRRRLEQEAEREISLDRVARAC